MRTSSYKPWVEATKEGRAVPPAASARETLETRYMQGLTDTPGTSS